MSDSEEENQDFSPNSRALITLSPHTAADMDLDLDGSWPFDQISSNPTSLICLRPSNQPCSSTWFFPDDNARNTTSTLVTDTGNPDSINESPAESGDNRRLPPPLRLTRLDYPDWSCAIKGRMAQALRCFKESTDQNVLAQVWAPVKSGDRYVLTTSGQPFVLDPRSNGLYQYRMASVMYMFSAGGERGGALGLPGRVFQQKMPEWTPNVQYYSSKEYPLLTYALNYNVQGSLALPVFEPSGQSCVGVFELIMTSPKINYAPEVDKVCKALEAVNLRSSEILDHPSTQICNEGRQEALVEILEILTVVCETHKLPLAQTWVPCRHRSVLAYGGGLKKTCSSFDGGCMEQVCMSTTDVAFYVVDAHMWGFREACSEHHLQKGQGVAGRAFESLNSCFCKDITQFCKTEYPLVHYARMFGLTSSFAICLRSTHTGSDDYILEFFLPPDIRDNREQHTLLDSIFLTMKQHFRSLKVASGKELEEEGTCVEIIEESMDEKLESMLQCIEMPQSDRSSLHLEAFSNEGDIMQLDSSETQSFEEFDATNITGKVVGADKSCTTISHQENKNTIKRLERKCRIAENEISLEVLQQHFDCKRLDVAKKLGVSVSTLKHVMRKHGIRRWPFRNKKIECSLFEPKLVTEFVHGAVGSFSPPTSSHTDVVGSSYPNSQGSKPPEPRIEKKMLSLFVGQAKIADQMLSAHEGQLQVQNRFHLHRQDARIVTLKATYGKTIVKLKLSSTSGIVELKEELAKKLKLEHGSFNVNYQDEDLEWILIACDADLYDCVTSSTSMGNQVIRLLVLDKVVNSKNSNKALEQHMAILPHTVPHAMTRNNAVTVTTLQVETDKSSLLSPQCLSGSIAQDNLAQSCAVPTLVTMDECFLEAERCINSSIELPCSNPALKLPTVTTAQTEIVDQMLESSHSAPKGQLQEQNRFHLQKQNARTATIKATYGDKTVRVPPPATSGIVKLKEELARRLELEHGSFYVEYEDEDHDWILIACDDVLQECLTFSRDNRVIRLAVRDEVVNSLRIPAKL